MDKIVLSENDINSLYKFRDNNKDLVRDFISPFKVIAIESKEYPIIIKVLEEEGIYKLSYVFKKNNLGFIKFSKSKGGKVAIIEDTMDKSIEFKNKESFISIYCSLMAYIANIPKEYKEIIRIKKEKTIVKKSLKKKSIKYNNVIYIKNIVYDTIKNNNKKSYTKPEYSFSVRGHYRNYKSGKKIWISQYEKNKKKIIQKSKKYKLTNKKEPLH